MTDISGDIPTIANYTSNNTSYSPADFVGVTSARGYVPVGATGDVDWVRHPQPFFTTSEQQAEEQVMAQAKRRLVHVYVVDPEESVPLDKSIIYQGGCRPHLTDLTDQELFFEIDIKNLLDKHNAERVKIRNKKVKDREEMLEPAKIRDLKMVVVNVAEF